MKNYRIILGSFIVSALFLSSCQDIDLLPKDNMPDELFWKTPDDFEKEVVGSEMCIRDRHTYRDVRHEGYG